MTEKKRTQTDKIISRTSGEVGLAITRSTTIGNASTLKYHLTDLVDISLFQQLFDSFFELTGMPYALLDSEGNILNHTGWNDICTNFHRVCPATAKNADRVTAISKVVLQMPTCMSATNA